MPLDLYEALVIVLEDVGSHRMLIWAACRAALWARRGSSGRRGKPFLLTVEDPQQPGTDIGSGAFNISQVVSPAKEDSLHVL